MSAVDISRFEKDIAIVKKKRAGGMRLGSEVPRIERIALDSPSLMRITEGGIPIGRVTRLWGSPSSGKSLLSLIIIASAQQHRSELFPNGLACTYWDVEGVWDELYARNLGIDTSKIGLQEAQVIEDIAAEMELLLGSCHLHVLDSASAAKATDALAAKPEDWLPMIEARAWERAWDRIENAHDTRENVIILIDHATENYKTKSKKAKGGKALDHASSMSIECSSGGWLFYHPVGGYLEKSSKITEEVGLNPNGVIEPDGCEIKVRISKSRVCRPLRSAILRFDFHTLRFDTTFEYLDAGQFFDIDGNPAHRSGQDPIITKSGGWRKVGEKNCNGINAIRQVIEASPEIQDKIRAAMCSGKW